MKCPTCGKSVKKGASVCSYCGAMVAPAAAPSFRVSSGERSSLRPPVIEETKRPAVQKPSPQMPEWPNLEPAEEMAGEAAEAPPEDKSAPAKPAPPAWIRYLSPLIFIVIFIVTQFWLREREPSLPQGSQPVLREAGLSDRIPERPSAGEPAARKTAFSIADDRQVVFVSTWSGSPRGRSFSVVWHPPQGPPRPSAQVIAQAVAGERQFSLFAVLRLEPGMPPGIWEAEVILDGKPVERYPFQLRGE